MMRKLKITVVLLVMFLVCQAAFAAYLPVDKADKEVTDQLATACDVLQSMALRTDDPVGFYKEVAGASDEDVVVLAILFGLSDGYRSVTTLDDLAKLFPRGVEATDYVNAFRRAAIHLAAYTARNGALQDTKPIAEAQESFNLFGYDFVVNLVGGDTIQFKYIDIYSAEEAQILAVMLAAIAPNAYDVLLPKAGEIDICTSGISEFGFTVFAREAESLMYSFFIM